jgi:hypothetical protein
MDERMLIAMKREEEEKKHMTNINNKKASNIPQAE